MSCFNEFYHSLPWNSNFPFKNVDFFFAKFQLVKVAKTAKSRKLRLGAVFWRTRSLAYKPSFNEFVTSRSNLSLLHLLRTFEEYLIDYITGRLPCFEYMFDFWFLIGLENHMLDYEITLQRWFFIIRSNFSKTVSKGTLAGWKTLWFDHGVFKYELLDECNNIYWLVK